MKKHLVMVVAVYCVEDDAGAVSYESSANYDFANAQQVFPEELVGMHCEEGVVGNTLLSSVMRATALVEEAVA